MKHPTNLVNNGQRLFRRRFWPCLSRQLMQESQGMHHLVNCSHHAVFETATEKRQNHIWSNSQFPDFYPFKFNSCSPPTLPSRLLHTPALSRITTKSSPGSPGTSLNLMQETLLVMYSMAFSIFFLFAGGKSS